MMNYFRGSRNRLLRHYLSFAILTIIAGTVLYLYKGKRDTITYLAWSSGYISFVFLAASLVTGTIQLLAGQVVHKVPVSTHFRRYMGITAGCLALFHSATGLFVHLRGKPWLYFLRETENGHTIRLDKFGLANYTGLISALLILILLATSNWPRQVEKCPKADVPDVFACDASCIFLWNRAISDLVLLFSCNCYNSNHAGYRNNPAQKVS